MSGMMRSPWGWLVAFVALLSASGCELSEVTLAEPENILVAEVYVMVGDGDDEITAFLHWTLGTGPDAPSLSGSEVTLIREDGTSLRLLFRPREACLLPEVSQEVAGACFVASSFASSPSPGSEVRVEILAPDGSFLSGSTTVPEAFALLTPAGGGVCYLPPSLPLTVRWSRSRGAWAYGAEAQIWGLRQALSDQGIEVEEDTVALLGLAISDSDTTVAFPGEFGVFDRFELDRELALALQEGMPAGASAEVVVAALDRNYVNWVRGGNFNPSGAVRVPSIRGDGTGVLASVYRRSFQVLGAASDPDHVACVPPGG